MINPLEYAKEHPVAATVIVVIGGIVFFVIFSGGGEGESSSTSSGPSDAEIMANAQITAAQIQQQGAIAGAQIGAGVQLNSDNKAAEVAMLQINAAKDVGLANIDAQKSAIVSTVNAQTEQFKAVTTALPSLRKKDRDNVLKSLVTGDYGYSGPPTNNTAETIGAVGNAAGSIGKAIGSVASVFSDQRLKENIVYLGTDDSGMGIYEFNYKGSKRRRFGRIAQDVAQVHPEYVHQDDHSGYLKVDARAF